MSTSCSTSSAGINGLTADEKLRFRKERSTRTLAELGTLLREQRSCISRSASVGEPMDYMLKHYGRLSIPPTTGGPALATTQPNAALHRFAMDASPRVPGFGSRSEPPRSDGNVDYSNRMSVSAGWPARPSSPHQAYRRGWARISRSYLRKIKPDIRMELPELPPHTTSPKKCRGALIIIAVERYRGYRKGRMP